MTKKEFILRAEELLSRHGEVANFPLAMQREADELLTVLGSARNCKKCAQLWRALAEKSQPLRDWLNSGTYDKVSRKMTYALPKPQ